MTVCYWFDITLVLTKIFHLIQLFKLPLLVFLKDQEGMVESSMIETPHSDGVPVVPGEQILVAVLKDVTYLCHFFGAIAGKMIVTNYKLYFYNESDKVMFSFT